MNFFTRFLRRETVVPNRPIHTHWDTLSDAQMLAKIHAEGTEMTREQVTVEYIHGMDHYRGLYPNYGDPLLSFMVRIDIKNGINTCSCGH